MKWPLSVALGICSRDSCFGIWCQSQLKILHDPSIPPLRATFHDQPASATSFYPSLSSEGKETTASPGEWKGREPTGHITHRLWELQGDSKIHLNLSIFHYPRGLGPCPGSCGDRARSRTGCPTRSVFWGNLVDRGIERRPGVGAVGWVPDEDMEVLDSFYLAALGLH